MSEWFEQQYADPNSEYSRCYRYGIPRGAVEENLYAVDFAIAVAGLHPLRDSVIEIGSGLGYVLDAWERRGFKAIGIEISPSAVFLSERRNIIVGDAVEVLKQIPDNAFEVGFSDAFLEHIPYERCGELLRELMRVAPLCAHYVAHEVGVDPSHINVLTIEEWIKGMKEWLGDKTAVMAVPNPLYPHIPLLINSRHGIPNRLHRAMSVRKRMAEQEQQQEQQP